MIFTYHVSSDPWVMAKMYAYLLHYVHAMPVECQIQIEPLSFMHKKLMLCSTIERHAAAKARPR